jgi:biopolymer transport protein TolR
MSGTAREAASEGDQVSPPGRPQAKDTPSGGSAAREAASVGASFGRLERAQGAAPMGDINMTPLIDVMLVLLVIFIITAPLMVSSVRVDLPRAAGASASTAAQFVELTINREGQVFVNDAVQSTEALARMLETTARGNADAEVRLRADSAVPYGRVVEVMGQAQKAGLNRIGFVADAPTKAKP